MGFSVQLGEHRELHLSNSAKRANGFSKVLAKSWVYDEHGCTIVAVGRTQGETICMVLPILDSRD